MERPEVLVYGLTKEHMRYFLGQQPSTMHMRLVTKYTAIKVYKELFWDPQRLSLINHAGLQHVLLVQAVCYGYVGSMVAVKAALSSFTPKGIPDYAFSIKTLLNAKNDYQMLYNILRERLETYIEGMGDLREFRGNQLRSRASDSHKNNEKQYG